MNRPPLTLAFSPQHPRLLMDLVLPPAAAGTPPPGGWPVIVWLHGGGWRLQDRTARPDFATHFAAAGFAMASIDYRLAPEHRHPAQLQDLRQAIRFLRARAEQLGLDPARIGLWGSSAGGHVATLAALLGHLERLPGEETEAETAGVSPAVACVVQGYAPAALDLLLPGPRPHPSAQEARDAQEAGRASQEAGQEPGMAEAPAVPPTTPEEDLLGGPAADAAGHRALLRAARAASPVHTDPGGTPPPFLMMHGTADRLVPAEQSKLLHQHLARHGGEADLYLLEGFGHGFLNPGQVLELGPGVVLDNGRLEREPCPPHTLFRTPASTFRPDSPAPSLETVREFFAHHLAAPEPAGKDQP